MIDFDWYRSFVAVYRSGTVSKAAEERLLTQPAVSNHVAALERAVGRPLFKRMPRRMVPTEYGKELYARVAEAVDTLEMLARRLAGEAAEEPLLRLGAPADYFAAAALDQLSGAVARLWVRFGESASLLEALCRDELDLVIATQRLPARGVEFAKLADERFLLVGAAHAASPPIGEGVDRWLEAQRWISFGPELPIVRRFWRQVFGRRPPIQPALVIPDLRAIARAVELGFGVSLLPDYLCRDAVASGRLRILWYPPEPVGNELWLAYRRSDRENPDVSLVRELLNPTREPSG